MLGWLTGWFRRRAPAEPVTAGESGALAQSFAERIFVERGWRTLARNLRDKRGELDLVMTAESPTSIIVVEVRSASERRHDSILALIPPPKQRQVCEAARWLLPKQRWWRKGMSLRFDAALVELGQGGTPVRMEHIENAFQSERRDWI